MTHLHSIPARLDAGLCEMTGSLAHPRLRPYVVGYGASRSARGTKVAHRVLPLNLVALIIELDGSTGLVTGPRTHPMLFERVLWGGHSVSIGLTPAGAAALLGVRMRDLVHAEVPLGDLLGRRGAELVERLAAAPDWPSRCALLDERLAAWLGTDRHVDVGILHAWARLQRSGRRPRIDTLAAELGVSRRTLELRFERHVGLAPTRVAGIARFQHALDLLSGHSDLPHIALECGYSDQPHFNREIRALSGLTPTRVRAFLQDQKPLAD